MKKAKAFAKELDALIKKHSVVLGASFGHISVKSIKGAKLLGYDVVDEIEVNIGGAIGKAKDNIWIRFEYRIPKTRNKGATIKNAPMISPDYASYTCPVTGRPIKGRTEHRENMKKHGSRQLEPGESREQESRQQESFERKNAEIIEKVTREIAGSYDG